VRQLSEGFTRLQGLDPEYVGTQLFSNLILAGLTVDQVRTIADSNGLPVEVAWRVQCLCDRFDRFHRSAARAA